MKTFTNTAEGRILALITGCAGVCIGFLKNVWVGVSLNPFEVNFREKCCQHSVYKTPIFQQFFLFAEIKQSRSS